MHRIVAALFALFCSVPAFAQESAVSPEQLDFFEKKVRPILVKHCYECHSAKAKKVKGGLLLDSRAGMLEGGDLGPAIVPGDPAKSRLIEAISYANVDLKMPRSGKLPDAVIADLTAWIKMGAPWPAEKVAKKNSHYDFNLAKRKQEHWCWRPIVANGPPAVKDKDWARTDIDRFLLAKLEAKGLRPAPPADPHTLLRRLYFDLIGVPPSRDDIHEFIKAWNAASDKQKVIAQVVDKLLESPHFGERWGRHWLDLVRYAETRGHEFDYPIPNAHQYRDYVIRAFNADVPYNQFVLEHIAGDLLKEPRLSAAQGGGLGNGQFNESILGTGFWFLNEEVHSPVDIRQDQADRFDNRIDVMTKTFLGLTVACARCHDHKFDAISTKDYYALFGILESSNYRQACFDSMTHNRKVAENLWDWRQDASKTSKRVFTQAVMPTAQKMDAHLLTAAGIEDRSNELDPAVLKRWKEAIAKALIDEASPLHAFAKAAEDKKRSLKEILDPILNDVPPTDPRMQALPNYLKKADMIIDYSSATAPWMPDDVTFGQRPTRPGDLILGMSPSRPIVRFVGREAAESDRAWDGLNVAPGAQNEQGSLGGQMRAGRTIRTPEFTLKHPNIYVRAKGNGMIYAAAGQHTLITGPLHGGLVQRFRTGDQMQWIAVNLAPYVGQRMHLEFTAPEQGDFAIELALQASSPPPPSPARPHRQLRLDLRGASTLQQLAEKYRRHFSNAAQLIDHGNELNARKIAPTANWIVQNSDLFIVPESAEAKRLTSVVTSIFEKQKKITDKAKLESRLAPAMQDGSGTDSAVFTRGNPKTPGEIVPRRFLEALAGPQKLDIKAGSGRLELAKQMIDPKMTPLITRVYVNRVWHHLFGRGIVASVDNFGVLGEAPTHPELLDLLADQFASPLPSGEGPGMREGLGWSTKKLIRKLVLTKAYQMSSAPDEKADQADAQNPLLHRMRLRRLEGEAIRDSILKVSGRLNPTMYGPAVPVFLTPFQDGRGKPGSGPLDGNGRRSIYLAVRRNFLSSFLLAFDTPTPFSTVGKRTVSNVPAQALILMNDPFVHAQAELWAKRVVAEKASNEQRIHGMYLDAFSRPPTEAELRTCMAYLGERPELRQWTDLAHVLYNAKEFYFLN